MSKFIKTVAAVSLACGVTFSANAGTGIVVNDQNIPTITVQYGDLNMDSAAGQETLSTRIRGAVRKVCGHTNGRQSVKEMTDYQNCVAQASQTALASLDSQTRARFAFKW